MKRSNWMHCLLGAAFAFLLAVSAVGNLVTGYDLKVQSMAGLVLWCACCALVSAFLFRFRFGGMAILCLTVLAAPFVWKDGMLWEQLRSLCYTVSYHYHRVYDWQVYGKPLTDKVQLPLLVLAAWSAYSVSWCYCRRRSIFWAVPAVIFPLAICLVTADREPDPVYLYLLVLGMVLLFLTGWIRLKKPAQSVRLTLRLAIPVTVAIALIFAMNPREKYVNKVGKYQKEVVAWVQELLDNTEPVRSGVSVTSGASKKLNLKYVGPQSKLSIAVMRVKASVDGTLYLRGRDYDTYTGTGWESSVNRRETFSSGTGAFGSLSVTTYGVRDVLYVPYYSTVAPVLINGASDNSENLQMYTYQLARSALAGTDVPDLSYTELPTDTLQWALGLSVLENAATLTEGDKVARIRGYVQNSAAYDLSTLRMRPDCSDFARWFLEESDTGYCVHFATATTVLLRAAGVPARYVEGYKVTCSAGEDVVVTNQEAHAWAEYYDSASGTWRVLEATPADLENEAEDATVITTMPEETEPKHTEGTTESALPERQTQPALQTDATGNTVSGQPESKKPFQLPDWIKPVFWSVLGVALVQMQSDLRIAWKRKRWNQGRANEKTIARWKRTRRMARLVKIPFPEELDALAQKAEFSQHRIRTDELQCFNEYREVLRETVKNKPWYRKIILRWIFAID